MESITVTSTSPPSTGPVVEAAADKGPIPLHRQIKIWWRDAASTNTRVIVLDFPRRG